MAKHIQTGKNGERLAIAWLADKGYSILYRNWRYSHYEIDIIASFKDVLHFIEVKTRTGNSYGWPEESVSKTKFKHLQMAADEFQFLYPEWKRVQYDILSIIQYNSTTKCFFIEDVYL